MRWEQVRHRRLARSALGEPATPEQLAEVVGRTCGIQAQVLAAAELGIGARVAGITVQDVRAALWQQRGLVKTYGPRGTLHLLPASELSRWMAALGGRSDWRDGRWATRYGLDPEQGQAAVAAIRDALDGQILTREELATAVGQRVGTAVQQMLASTWGLLQPPAAFAGALCFGPNRGAKVTFVRADQWVGGWPVVDPDIALLEIARAYLRTYGPATRPDLARWLGLQKEDANRVWDALADELEQVEVEGYRAWLLASDADDWPEPTGPALRLLPQYDAYVLGSYPRERIVPEPVGARAFEVKNGRFEGPVGLPLLLVDGVVAGIWERKQRGKRIDLRVEPTLSLSPAQSRQLEAEAARIGVFLGVEASLEIGALS